MAKKHEKFAVLPFIYHNTLTLLIIFAGIKLLAPEVWQKQLEVSWQMFAVTFVCIHLAAAFVEFFFHRYVLHMVVIPFFAHFYQQHNLHHDLTHINREGMFVSNEFPITQEPQYEASFFPWWTLLAFSAMLTPFFIVIYILFPTIPIFIAGYTALLFSMVLYELFHAAWHWPLETWKRLFATQYFGGFWRTVYTFHLRHHADVRCNESVSGFFGIPLPDLLFNTYIKAGTLYPHKQMVDAKEFEPPKPVFFIRWLDKLLS
jgi:hemolysin III